MSEAVVIYPHQLFKDSPVLTIAREKKLSIYLVEEPLILTHNPIHRQKLIFHKLTLEAYETFLKQEGHDVMRLSLSENPKTNDVFATLKADGVTTVHIIDTTDYYLERAITASSLERVWYDTPLFLLTKTETCVRYEKSKRFMASFYKGVRHKLNILIDEDGNPVGGAWSFDANNRKSLPKNTGVPADPVFFQNIEVAAAVAWADEVPAEQYGEAGCWLPYTHEAAQHYLHTFLNERLATFGPYEDAISTEHVRLWHSTLSPLLNVGLLTPAEVLRETLAYAHTHDVPLSSLEGFIRQLIGWREFIRASYEVDGKKMRTQNFFKHKRSLPNSLWDGTTGMLPIDYTIKRALQFGYNHHIERLMIMGNFMLLTQTNPNEVYRWFMGMYVDAYDWVMVPNVYGMSQYADGGSFATKPYISGANYVKKMSNFPKGDWEELWTALYWYFIASHESVFKKNHRLSMMPKLLEKMNKDKRATYLAKARNYLARS